MPGLLTHAFQDLWLPGVNSRGEHSCLRKKKNAWKKGRGKRGRKTYIYYYFNSFSYLTDNSQLPAWSMPDILLAVELNPSCVLPSQSLYSTERVKTNKQMHGLIAVRCEEKQTGGMSVPNNKR